jgi:plastocyanin
MKKIYLILFATFIISGLNATTFFIVPGPGPQWSPTLTTVAIGDVVQFGLSATHPANEVSQTTWMANQTATLAGGFGSKNTSYQFTVTATTASTIFFVCPTHVGNTIPMKGMIVKAGSTGLSAINNQITQVSLFPNPAASEVNISVPSNLSDVTLKLIGINGQEIALTTSNQIFTNNSNTVLTAILPNSIGNGVYFIEISAANERIYKKIVITK